MDRLDAVTAVELVQPGVVIPCHYDTLPPITTDGQAFKSNAAPPRRVTRRRARPAAARLRLPIHHFPADRDRRAGVQVRRRGSDRRRGRRPAAGAVALGMTHAIVLIEAERDALATLGGELA